MAKLTGPLMSLSANGAIGRLLVFFPWKGLNVARSYVVPANPQTAAQQTQRGYLSDAVDLVHAAEVEAANPLDAADTAAYALRASTRATPRTWFNECTKEFVDQKVAALFGAIYRDGETTPGAGQLAVSLYFTKDPDSANSITAGNVMWGTSKSALINTEAAAIAAGHITATIAGLAAGTKYYWKFVSTAHNDFDGTESGIYYGTPT